MRPFLPFAAGVLVGVLATLGIRALSGRPRLTQERVLAEAVSSYADTGQFFVAASTVTPFTPLGYYRSRATADSAVGRAGGSYRVFGPYPGLARPDPFRVVSVTVRVRTDSGERDLHYLPGTDAVFLTVSAMQKFMIPYYRRLYGNDYAETLDSIVLVPAPPRPPTPPCHLMSVPCTSTTLLTMSPMHR